MFYWGYLQEYKLRITKNDSKAALLPRPTLTWVTTPNAGNREHTVQPQQVAEWSFQVTQLKWAPSRPVDLSQNLLCGSVCLRVTRLYYLLLRMKGSGESGQFQVLPEAILSCLFSVFEELS